MPTDKLTVLFLAANPADTDQLKLDEEMRAIDRALRDSAFRDRFDLRSAWAVRYGDLQELLLRHEPHIVHFSGHGSELGEIALTSDSGVAQLVPPEALAALFDILKDNIRCVVLNACYSETQARGIAKSIDCVVGMKRAVTDKAALDFASGFYLGLGYGRSVKTAFDMGSNRIGLAGGDEAKTPKLLSPRIDPATIVLVSKAAQPPLPDPASNQTSAAPSYSASGDVIVATIGPNSKGVAVGKNIQQNLNTEEQSGPSSKGAVADNNNPPNLKTGEQGAASKYPARLGRGRQYAQFQDALLSAYDLDSLRQMVRLNLDANLDAVAGGTNLRTVIFNLIDWAQRTGRLPALIEGALEFQPNNPDLQTFVKAFQ